MLNPSLWNEWTILYSSTLYSKIAKTERLALSWNLSPITRLCKWNLLRCLSSSRDFKRHLQTSYWLHMLTFQSPIYSSPDRWYLEHFSDMKSHLMNQPVPLLECSWWTKVHFFLKMNWKMPPCNFCLWAWVLLSGAAEMNGPCQLRDSPDVPGNNPPFLSTRLTSVHSLPKPPVGVSYYISIIWYLLSENPYLLRSNTHVWCREFVKCGTW